MMPYQSYQLFQAGRPMSIAEQRVADARAGELAAAVSRPIIAASARIRAALRWQSAGFGAQSTERLTVGSERQQTAENSADVARYSTAA